MTASTRPLTEIQHELDKAKSWIQLAQRDLDSPHTHIDDSLAYGALLRVMRGQQVMGEVAVSLACIAAVDPNRPREERHEGH